MRYVWTYNYRYGGADVFRLTEGHKDWVGRVANGILAEALIKGMKDADSVFGGPIPLDINPQGRTTA